MRRSWPLVIVLCLTRPAHAADVQVRVNGPLVDIQATAAPLQEVLARLAQHTGMKVVYDGAPPRMLVTLTLGGRTPPEAVLALFEGLGVNYAMMADRTGLRVDMLLVTSVSSGSAGPSSTNASRGAPAANAPPPPEQRVRPQRPAPTDADADDDQEDDAARATPPPRGPGGINGPVQGGPAQLVSPFGGQILPLTLPTPAAPAAPANPSPSPSPTPSPGRLEGR